MPSPPPGQWSLRAATALAPYIYTQGSQTVNALKGANGAQSAVLNLWSGAAYRYDTDQMYVLLAGGDQDGASNEGYLVDLAADVASRCVNPTVSLIPSNAPNVGTSYYVDSGNAYGGGNFPAARHTYNGLVHQPGTNLIWVVGGAIWAHSGDSVEIFSYNTATNAWTTYAGALGSHYFSGHLAVWDSTANRLLILDDQHLLGFTAAGGTTTLLTTNGDTVVQHRTGLFDPTRNRLVMAGYNSEAQGLPTVVYYTLNALTDPPTVLVPTGVLPMGAFSLAAPGFDRDPAGDRYVLYAGGATVYFIHPVTGAVTAETGTGATPPAIAATGSFGRVRYSPNRRVLVSVQDFSSGAALYTPLAAAPVPVLACADLTSGPKTGNADTAFGQVANEDGVYVTLFGTNLGLAGDTVSATCNGAPMRIIDRGPAQPPRCPANLANGHQQLSCIVAQVSHLAAAGAGALTVTVNGVVSNTLPFTVQAGTIRFAGPGGYASIAAGVAAMVSGDVLYIKDGLTALTVDTTGLNPPGLQTTLAAYPGATVTLGDATHDPFPTGFAGFNIRRTYAKLTIVGAGQALTLGDFSRAVGCKFSAPTGAGSQGTLGVFGGSTVITGNEFTQCGGPTDSQYHVLYRYGHRGVASGTEYKELGCAIEWNYFHDNKAARAINCFNGVTIGGTFNNPIGDHTIRYNVIVNQEWAGIGQQDGVIGTNLLEGNLLINCGRGTYDPSGQLVGVQLNAGYPAGTPVDAPITITVRGNTFVNCGDVTAADRGVFEFARAASTYSLVLQGNICYQTNGIQYVSPNSDAISVDAARRSDNLWWPAAPPAFDTSPSPADPLFVSTAGPGNYRLQATSPAIGQSVALGPGTDLDGATRPGATPWTIGAYEFSSAAVSVGPTIAALAPATAVVGTGGFTLTVTGSNFTSNAVVQWGGSPRATVVDSATQLRATILTGDVATVATVGVTVLQTVGTDVFVSPAVAFRVLYPPASLGLVYEGKIRDRVGQGEVALSPDGIMDGTLAVMLNGSGGRVITAMRLQIIVTTAQWDTTLGNGFWILGVASSRDGALLNNPTTGAVGFTVADGETFYLFAGDMTTTLFDLGSTLTLTVTLGDGSTVVQAVTIGAAGTAFVRTTQDSLALTDGPLTRVVLPPTSKPIVDVDLTQPPGLHATIRRVS